MKTKQVGLKVQQDQTGFDFIKVEILSPEQMQEVSSIRNNYPEAAMAVAELAHGQREYAGLFRRAVGVIRASNMGPRELTLLLQAEGFALPRVSEFKAVAALPDEAFNSFVEGNLGFKAAVEQARFLGVAPKDDKGRGRPRGATQELPVHIRTALVETFKKAVVDRTRKSVVRSRTRSDVECVVGDWRYKISFDVRSSLVEDVLPLPVKPKQKAKKRARLVESVHVDGTVVTHNAQVVG